MKYSLLFLLSFLVLTACQQPTFRLDGKLTGVVKSESVKVRIPGTSRDSVVTVVPVREGEFHLILPALPQVVEITADEDYITVPVVTEAGDYMLLADRDEVQLTAPAGSLQKRFDVYTQKLRALEKDYNGDWQGYDTVTDIQRKADVSAKMSRKFEAIENLRLQAVREFAGTEVSQYIIYKVLYYYNGAYKAFDRAMEALGDTIPESPMKTVIVAAYEKLKAAQLSGEAPVFTLPDKDGREVSLTDFRGKYVLVDFWASWCAPCREKNRHLNKHYDTLKTGGIELISISLDDNKQQWLKAVREDNIQWTQLVDLSGFKDSRIRKAYKVEQVPTVYLIDPQGKVVTANPTEEELKAVLKGNLDIS